MKQAVELCEELFDSFGYIKTSYLDEPLSEEMKQDILVLSGAASYVYDRLFAKQNAGTEITTFVLENYQGSGFSTSSLANLAKSMLDEIDNGEFFKGKSRFRDYLNYIHDDDQGIEEACKDDEGLFIFVLSDLLCEIIVTDTGEDKSLKGAELVFLNVVNVILNYLKVLYGKNIKKKASYSYLQSLQDKFEYSRYKNEI